MVHFEAGASITKVLFASDFSAIHISGLPRDSKSETILALLRSHGLDTSNVSNVRVNRGAGISSARVQAEDPGFAKAAGIKLGPQNASSRAALGIQAVPAPVGISTASDSSALRVDCKKVHCSWHKASKTVWLNFGNGDIADRVAKKFKDGKYKILDQIVHPNDPTRGGGGRHNPKAWTVCLTEVLAAATRTDVVNSIRLQSDKPRDVHLGEPTYKADADTCSAVVQSLFTAVGPLEWWELTPDTTGKRMKASARFLNEEDAKEAAKTLNNSALPFHKTAKLTVQIVHSAKFKVSSVIFETVQSQIKANIQDWKQLHLHYIAYPEPDPPKWYRVLKIEGESPSGVAAAKDTIANILAGVVARDGTGVLWHPSLRGNGAILEKLKELQKKTGILIVRNKAKSQLRLYGPQKRCEEVPALIAGILGAEGSEEFAIELSTQQFHWACQGGFKKIISELGPNNVNFDVISTPKRITITGTAVEHDVALSIVNGKEAPSRSRKVETNAQDCSVCWTEAENPVQTQCNHVYCLDCFENLCLSASTQDASVQVRCAGDSNNCAKTLGLPELQEHLSSSAFEELLEQSFASYVRRHPNLLRHCPSPECEYVYRIGGAAKMHTCPSCFVPVCTGCQAQHGDMSCTDYQEVSSGRHAANEKLKREMGIKDCPKCKTPLEKTDGCDHMICQCGAHICWVCLETFQTSGDCYGHMKARHGGIGLDHFQGMFG